MPLKLHRVAQSGLRRRVFNRHKRRELASIRRPQGTNLMALLCMLANREQVCDTFLDPSFN